MVRILTKEEILAARQDKSHLVVKTLDEFSSHWQELMNAISTDDSKKRYSCSSSYMIPFADRLEGQDFPLGPLEIVSIWQSASEHFSKSIYPRYKLAQALACVYGTFPIQSEFYKNLFRKISRENSYLKTLEVDINLDLFKKRLTEIKTSLDDLNYFFNGTAESMADLTMLVFVKKEEEARIRLEKMVASQERNASVLPEGVIENMGTGLMELLGIWDIQ